MDPHHAAHMWGDDVFLSDEFQLTCEPVPHAIEGVHELLARGDSAIVVSDRPQRLLDATQTWLREHDLDLPLIFTRSVHSLSTEGMTKSQIAYLYKLRHVVEDAPHHAEWLGNRSYVDQVYLLDKPYNRDVEHEKVTRVDSWKEIA